MKVIKTISPGQPGAQRDCLPGVNQQALLAQRNKQWVAVRIDYNDTQLREQVKAVGAKWSKRHKAWLMQYDQALAADVIDRIVPALASQIRDVDLYA